MDTPTYEQVLNAKFIGELPDSNEQWQIAVTKSGTVVLVNNDHAPRAIVYGELVVISNEG